MNRALEVFEMVVALHGSARTAALERACADDAALRAEVESLLAAHDRAGAFLGDPTHGGDDGDGISSSTSAGEARTAASAGEDDASARVIGPYRLLQHLGEGGFGTVWLAEQTEPVRRRVALKIIKAGMDTRQVIARFEAERQALAMMDHPNIARVLDAGSTEAGRPYFVMELVKGLPILQYCDAERLGTRARLELFGHVCHAIQHAHQKGIIHRDIKPSNVMVAMHDGVPVPKVIDFGIAKATSAELTTRTLFTGHQQLIGTPAYMSPEQVQMGGLDIDTRSDIYSLGVLLYELLTGSPPFANEELLHAGFAEMMRIIREVEPAKPSTRIADAAGPRRADAASGTRAEGGPASGESAASAESVAQSRQLDARRLSLHLRGDLDWIVMKCLEKDRQRRYETASALAADVRRHLDDEPVTAGPPSARYRVGKFARRHRAGVIAASIIVTVLLLGAAGTTAGMLRALSAERDAQRELHRATEVKQLITRMLASFRPDVARAAETEQFRSMLDETVASLENGGISDELVAAELHHVVGVVYRTLGMWSQAEQHLPVAADVFRRLLGEDDPATMQAELDLIILSTARADFRSIEPALRENVARRMRVLGAEHPDTLHSREALAGTLGSTGRAAEAESIVREVLEIRMRDLGPDDRKTLHAQEHLAALLAKQGKLDESEPLMVRALAGRRRVLGKDHPDTLNTTGYLARLYEDQGRLEDAEPLRVETVSISFPLLGDDHPFSLLYRTKLAILYARMGRPADACAVGELELRDRRRVDGTGANRTWDAMRRLAAAYELLGRREEALSLYRELLGYLPSDAGEPKANPYALSMVAWVLTRDLAELNDPGRALAFAQRAVAIGERRQLRTLHQFLDVLALVRHQLGDTAGAIELERRAAEAAFTDQNNAFGREYEARLRTYEAALADQP